MIYETLPYRRRSLFLYAHYADDTNFIQYGVGYRSTNGLQVKHVEIDRVHLLEMDRELGFLDAQPYIDVGEEMERDFMVPRLVSGDKKGEFIALIERVWKEACDPRKLRRIVRIDEHGRAVFLKYNARKDAIEIGLERVSQGVSQLSSTAAFLDHKGCLTLAAPLFVGSIKLSFNSTPPNWGNHPTTLSKDLAAEVAKALVSMSDAIWSPK